MTSGKMDREIVLDIPRGVCYTECRIGGAAMDTRAEWYRRRLYGAQDHCAHVVQEIERKPTPDGFYHVWINGAEWTSWKRRPQALRSLRLRLEELVRATDDIGRKREIAMVLQRLDEVGSRGNVEIALGRFGVRVILR